METNDDFQIKMDEIGDWEAFEKDEVSETPNFKIQYVVGQIDKGTSVSLLQLVPLAQALDQGSSGITNGMCTDQAYDSGGKFEYRFSLAQYSESSDRFGFFESSQSNSEKEYFFTQDYTETAFQEQLNQAVNSTFTYRLKSSVVITYLRRPPTLMSALQKIGALLALFKIATLLSYLHFRGFE